MQKEGINIDSLEIRSEHSYLNILIDDFDKKFRKNYKYDINTLQFRKKLIKARMKDEKINIQIKKISELVINKLDEIQEGIE